MDKNISSTLIKQKGRQDNPDNQVEPAGRLIRDVSYSQDTMKQTKKFVYLVYGILVVLGIGTGYVLAKTYAPGTVSSGKREYINTDKTVGVTDVKTFKDSASGTLEKGGINGEGTHKLIRPGGPSQTAYLISSVVDLDQYIGKKVKIWGQTIAAQKAAWLMDVGKIELQE